MKPGVQKVRVLIVDDSALARRAIGDALSRDPELEVVGYACDPYVARDQILSLQPDVITLDLEMPRMDGLAFLKILHPFEPGQFSPRRIIVIGASTGGVEALRYLLPRLPDGLPPIVVVQHIPAPFSRTLAAHLNALCAFTVREAVNGDPLHPGLCLVAPGNFHLTLGRAGLGYRVRLTQSPPVHHCRPSVDILFRSAAEQAGNLAVAALLTGMGVDGAHGLQLLRAVGARTLAEDQESCVVFGMPQAAIKLGAAEQVVPLPRIPQAILKMLSQPVLE